MIPLFWPVFGNDCLLTLLRFMKHTLKRVKVGGRAWVILSGQKIVGSNENKLRLAAKVGIRLAGRTGVWKMLTTLQEQWKAAIYTQTLGSLTLSCETKRPFSESDFMLSYREHKKSTWMCGILSENWALKSQLLIIVFLKKKKSLISSLCQGTRFGA